MIGGRLGSARFQVLLQERRIIAWNLESDPGFECGLHYMLAVSLRKFSAQCLCIFNL